MCGNKTKNVCQPPVYYTHVLYLNSLEESRQLWNTVVTNIYKPSPTSLFYAIHLKNGRQWDITCRFLQLDITFIYRVLLNYSNKAHTNDKILYSGTSIIRTFDYPNAKLTAQLEYFVN